MTFERPYGKREGLVERLGDWRRRMAMDKSLPWVGIGLIDDLDATIEALGGKVQAEEYDL